MAHPSPLGHGGIPLHLERAHPSSGSKPPTDEIDCAESLALSHPLFDFGPAFNLDSNNELTSPTIGHPLAAVSANENSLISMDIEVSTAYSPPLVHCGLPLHLERAHSCVGSETPTDENDRADSLALSHPQLDYIPGFNVDSNNGLTSPTSGHTLAAVSADENTLVPSQSLVDAFQLPQAMANDVHAIRRLEAKSARAIRRRIMAAKRRNEPRPVGLFEITGGKLTARETNRRAVQRNRDAKKLQREALKKELDSYRTEFHLLRQTMGRFFNNCVNEKLPGLSEEDLDFMQDVRPLLFPSNNHRVG